jgi:hypothetical protein
MNAVANEGYISGRSLLFRSYLIFPGYPIHLSCSFKKSFEIFKPLGSDMYLSHNSAQRVLLAHSDLKLF